MTENVVWHKLPLEYCRDNLSTVSADKREKLVIMYIAAANQLGDTFYADDKPDRQSQEATITEGAIQCVNHHLDALIHEEKVEILYHHKRTGERQKLLLVNPKSKLPDDMAEALIEAYEQETLARPASIREALKLVASLI